MGLLTLEKFLCCLSLESGGYICSVFTGVVSIIIFISTFVDLFFNMFNHSAGAWVTLVINIFYYGILTYASWQLFQGTKNSLPEKMRLFLIFMLVGVVIGFLQVFLGGWLMLIFSFIWLCIVLYFYACIRSLFQKVGGGSVIC